jgi:cellobiose-specific phosphotransferase system component IIA
MKIENITKAVGAILLTGALGLAGAPAFAAEDAAGVYKHAVEASKTAKEAIEHAKAGHKEQTLETLKVLRTHTKELTGDPIGKNIQRANSRIREAIAATEGGNTAEAATKLEDAVKELQVIEQYAAGNKK